MVLDTLAEYDPALAAGQMDILSAGVENVTRHPPTSYLDSARRSITTNRHDRP